MKNNTYYVIDVKETATGKSYATALKVPNVYNLLGYFERTIAKGFELISINACGTWKEAQKIAEWWNECKTKNNNSYLYNKEV